MGRGKSSSYDHWREHHDETNGEDQKQDTAMDEDRTNGRPRRRSTSYNQESYDQRLQRRSRAYNQDSYEDQSEYDPAENDADTYTNRPRRRSIAQDENEYRESARRRSTSARNPVPSVSKVARPAHRKRKVWPMLLTGCALGVVFAVAAAAVIVLVTIHSLQSNSNLPSLPGFGIGSKPFSKTDVLNVSLPTINQVQICDRVGDVTLKVDPDLNASKITVEASKVVQVANQAAADQEFQHILVEVQPPTALTQPLTCAKSPSTPAVPISSASATPSATSSGADNQSNALTVNVTFPTSGNVNDKVNINITFPQSALQSAGPTLLVDVEAPLGKVNLDGISGLLNVKGGDTVTVQHAVLADQSQLETANGSVKFSGFLALPTDPNQKAKYLMQGENGIDVTLPVQTNVLLDANTNQGTGVINNEFNTTNNDHTAIHYYGPINPAITMKPAAVLQLDVGSGNVNIHKTQTP